MSVVTEIKTHQVTSRRHEHALTVLLDDIRLQIKRANGPGLAAMGPSDSTPYQSAQALEVRVQDWVRHEMEFCKFRNQISELVFERLLRHSTEVDDIE